MQSSNAEEIQRPDKTRASRKRNKNGERRRVGTHSRQNSFPATHSKNLLPRNSFPQLIHQKTFAGYHSQNSILEFTSTLLAGQAGDRAASGAAGQLAGRPGGRQGGWAAGQAASEVGDRRAASGALGSRRGGAAGLGLGFRDRRKG